MVFHRLCIPQLFLFFRSTYMPVEKRKIIICIFCEINLHPVAIFLLQMCPFPRDSINLKAQSSRPVSRNANSTGVTNLSSKSKKSNKKRGISVSMKKVHDNESSCSPEEQARKIYNDSVNKPTSYQEQCVADLKKLYDQSPLNEVADFYAGILFNLSLKVSGKKMQEICSELEELFQQKKTHSIAEAIGRLTFNLSTQFDYNITQLEKCAIKIKELYDQFPTDALAEPLAKIWHSIAVSQADNRLEYAQKIIALCSNMSNPEANTAFARILFDPEFSVKNREQLITSFLSNRQALDSFGVYVESPYYPDYNYLLSNFKLSPLQLDDVFINRINRDFRKLKTRKNYTELKAELMALLYYTLTIKKLLMVSKTKKMIGHYTKIENLKYLIPHDEQSGKLRMWHASYMNDPLEGKTLINFLTDEKGTNNNLLCNENSKIYLACFTTAIDELPMWSMYGNDGQGCCLVFKGDYFDYSHENYTEDLILSGSEAGDNNYLYRVCYLSWTTKNFTIHNSEEFSKKLGSQIKALNCHYSKLSSIKETNDMVVERITALILDQIRYLFKDSSYAHEHELRLIRYSETPKVDENAWIIPQLYLEIEKSPEYSQVILGPKTHQGNRITPYLLHSGKVGEVKKSKISYR